jgi:hypothetical protein
MKRQYRHFFSQSKYIDISGGAQAASIHAGTVREQSYSTITLPQRAVEHSRTTTAAVESTPACDDELKRTASLVIPIPAQLLMEKCQ